ncbi:MAG: heparinase II/III family protein, partial [Oscillospiraceae bacterium]
NGYPIICDPGVFTYKDDANRYYYKSSKTHNMVTVNNMEPWEYKNGWAYGPQKEGSIVAVEETSRMMYAICKHYNYDPIIIERVIAIIDHEYVLILDKVYGIQPSDTVQIQFHVDETNLLTKNNSVVTVSEKENIALYHSKGAKVTIVDGKISDYNDVEHPSKIVRFEYETIQQSTFAAVSILKPEQPKSDYTQIIITKSQLDENSLTLSLVVGNRNYEIVWENDKLFLLS